LSCDLKNELNQKLFVGEKNLFFGTFKISENLDETIKNRLSLRIERLQR
jgi:hypothetical protein